MLENSSFRSVVGYVLVFGKFVDWEIGRLCLGIGEIRRLAVLIGCILVLGNSSFSGFDRLYLGSGKFVVWSFVVYRPDYSK